MLKNWKWAWIAMVALLWRLHSGVAALMFLCVAGQVEAQTAGSIVGWGRVPAPGVPAEDDFVAVGGGETHSLVLRADGSLAAWGSDYAGQVSGTPVGNDFVAIAAGYIHNLALKGDGTIVAWGEDGNGQVSDTPSDSGFVDIAAGLGFSLAIRSDGTITGWGADRFGVLSGIPSGTGFAAISAGWTHGLALKTDGSLVGWGDNRAGQTSVPAGTDFVAIGCGSSSSLALKADGSLVAWGTNYYGQNDVPEGNDFVAIPSWYWTHCLALRSDGTVAAWGDDFYGQVSDTPSDSGFVAIGVGAWHSLSVFGNRPPVADAGPDQTAECTGALTTVCLNASASSDPDGDPLGYEWSLPEGSSATIDDPASPTPTGSFPLGPTLVTLVVTDGNGGIDVDDVLVTVVDTVPPVLVATTDKIALWPPNHEMHDVLVSVEITDCAWDTGVVLTAWVSSNEPDDATGDGSYVGDVDGQDGFAAPVPVDLIYTSEPEPGVYLYEGLVSLRAERDGSENSRAYSIVCDIEDLGGNMSTASCVVVVPHDRRNK